MDTRNLKILVVYPMYGGSLPVARYCFMALQEMGCLVRALEADKLYCAYTGLQELDLSTDRINHLANNFLRFTSQAIVMMAEEQKPDLLLALAQAPLDRNALLKLRKMKIPTVMWFVEDYKLFDYWTLMGPLYSAFAVIQKEPFLTELKKIGQDHAFYLPLAASAQFHKDLELSEKDKKIYGSQISFMGSGYPNRHLVFRRLADRDFKIWGTEWEGDKLLEKNVQQGGRRISPEESVKIYNSSIINLNLHSSIHTDSLISHGDFINPRTFELAAMGAFQLVDKRSLMGELFSDEELATFETIEELYSKIDYFLEHPEERQKYMEKGRKKVLEEHTYQKRMRSLLEYMDKNFGPLVKQSEASASNMEGTHPEAVKEAEEIARKLGLSPHAGFAEIVNRLRKQSGKLTEAETALLFLDEWRKQYSRKA